MIYKGKSDLLFQYKDIVRNLSAQENRILDKVSIGGKTCGWVSAFINEYFAQINGISDKPSITLLRRRYSDPTEAKFLRDKFRSDFPELSMLLELICDEVWI
ncbi:MAG TPA: hypothetical protein PLA74_08540 [Syntrophales bacterium]|nr:hypothetical protein [Syntrophales bacterium]